MKKRALMKSTQVACYLSLNVVTRDRGGERVIILPLVTLTAVFFFLWQLSQVVGRQWFTLAAMACDIAQAFDFSAKVFSIGFKALAFGLGVQL